MKAALSSVSIANGYGLDNRMIRVQFLAGARNFSLPHYVQTSSGAQPASYPVGTRGSFPQSKVAGVWRWPLTCIYCQGQKMHGDISPLPLHVFMAWCLVKYRDNFTFLRFYTVKICWFLFHSLTGNKKKKKKDLNNDEQDDGEGYVNKFRYNLYSIKSPNKTNQNQ
jgi:hypothetical protein